MNDALKAKLRDILFKFTDTLERTVLTSAEVDPVIAQIEQAFREGWSNEGFSQMLTSLDNTVKEAANLMPGQYWYDRFDALLPPDNYHRDYVLEIAKKAAGVE